MEDKMSKLNDSKLEQVTGGKSYSEWEAYFKSLFNVHMEERSRLVNFALYEIENDPDLSTFDKKRLVHMADALRGKMADIVL